MGQKFYSLIILLLCIRMPMGAFAQEIKFEHLTSDHGLSNNSVRCFFQDRTGYLWIGTEDGLCKYDGYSFTVYKSIPDDTTSLSDNMINQIYEDKSGRLWIATSSGGLNQYRVADDKFKRYKSTDRNNSLINNEIVYLFEDHLNRLWCMSSNAGLNLYQAQTDDFKRVYLPMKGNSSLLLGQRVYEDSNHYFWIAGNTGLICYQAQTGEIKKFLPQPSHPSDLANRVDMIVPESDKLLYVLVDANLYLFDTQKGSFSLIDLPYSKYISDFPVLYLKNESSYLWLCTYNGGLLRFDKKTKEFKHFVHEASNPSSLSSNIINTMYEDRSGSIWIGTYLGGINKFDRKHKFNNGLKGQIITSIFELDGTEWIGTQTSGLFRHDKKTDQWTNYSSSKTDNNSLSYNSIGSVFIDSKDVLWVGTWEHGLNRAKLTAKGKLKFEHLLPSESILCLAEDAQKRLWVGANGYLYLHEPQTDRFISFENDAKNPNSIGDTRIQCIVPDKSGNLWIGTWNGLYCAILPKQAAPRPQNVSFKAFRYEMSNKNSLSDDRILSICISSKGVVWIGTFAGGLDKLEWNGTSHRITRYTQEMGLPSNCVFGIQEDGGGLLWISTNKGLVSLDPRINSFTAYDQNDGLHGNDFNWRSSFKSSTGTMYFGGSNGYDSFLPSDIQLNPYIPPVVITGFSIFNRLVSGGKQSQWMKTQISVAKEITIEYNESMISFDYAAMNYISTNKNRYKYKMEGFDQDWVNAGYLRKATYTNLDPGVYTFRVIASNNDGVWNTEGASIQLRILPPWWRTLWFRSLAALTVVLVVLLVIRIRTHQLQSQKNELERMVKKRTSQLEGLNAQLIDQQTEILEQKEKIEHQYTSIKIITSIGQKITASIKAQEIIKRVYSSINALMDAPMFSIGQVNEQQQTIEFWGYVNKESNINYSVVSLNDEDRMSVWCTKNKQLVFMNDVENDIVQYFNKSVTGYTGDNIPKSSIYLPLMSFEEKVIGILVVKSNHKEAYTPTHLDILKNLAAFIAIALDNAMVYKELENNSEKLKEMDLLKTRFFINISHEFRTPLTLILGPVEKMLRDFKQKQYEEYIGALEMIHRNSRQLLNLINQLLEMRKIETGTMQLKLCKTNIVAFVSNIVSLFRELAKQNSISLKLNASSEVILAYIDHEKMEKVLFNLLSNAFKFTPNNGCIQLNMAELAPFDEYTEGAFELIVQDSGAGIKTENLAYIFDRFYQVPDSKSFMQEGSGIGLSLTKDLIEMHKGKIDVESTLGIGTRFRLHLPLGEGCFDKQMLVDKEATKLDLQYSDKMLKNHDLSPQPQKNTVQKEPASTAIKKILVVEDNSDMRHFIQTELNDEYHIDEACDGEEGVEKAFEHLPDLIITDWMMPKMNGMELCKKLKNDIRTSHIPIILLTAKGNEESTIEGYETQADDYVTKPFNMKILKAKIKSLLLNREQLKKLFVRRLDIEPLELSVNAVDEDFITKILKIVKDNLENENFNIQEFAREMGMSRSDFYRKFKALTGQNPLDFVLIYRLKQSLELLKQNKYTITEISYKVGFMNPKYFGRRFKTQFGMTPTEYLQKNKA